AFGMHLSFSLSRSFLPPAMAVRPSFSLPGLMPASETLSGTSIPGAVHPPAVGSIAPSALASALAVSPGGVIATGPSTGVAVHEAEPRTRHTSTGKRHTPFTAPSASHALPSVQVAFVVGMPANWTKQSVVAGPPPATHGQSARATPVTVSRRETRTKRLMGILLLFRRPSGESTA